MKIWLRQNFEPVEWLVGAVISLMAGLAWILSRDIGRSALTPLDLFPLLGLVAFGLMWSHYTLGSLRRWVGYERPKKTLYWTISTGLVLLLIVAHPLLLNYSLIAAGLGLPPANYFAAYGSLEGWFAVLGMICLVVFLLFELRRWYSDRSWWRWVEYGQIVAMGAIFVHATILGREVSGGWYAGLWWVLGATLVVAWVYNWKYDHRHKV